MQSGVEYLGYVIDKEGIHPVSRKVEAICDVPAPSNITELWPFLDMSQFYARFIDGYSTLTNLLKVDHESCYCAFLLRKNHLNCLIVTISL